MLGIDERAYSTGALCLGDGMKSECRLTTRLRPVNLDDTTPRIPSNACREVEGKRTRSDGSYRLDIGLVAQGHDGPFSELLFDRHHDCAQDLHFLSDLFEHDVLLSAPIIDLCAPGLRCT